MQPNFSLFYYTVERQYYAAALKESFIKFCSINISL